MEERMTREQFLEKIFNKSYDELKGKKLRLTRLTLPMLSALPDGKFIRTSAYI